MQKTKRNFGPEFKENAVNLVIDGGRRCSDVACEYDLSLSIIANWVRVARVDRGEGEAGQLTSSERQELTLVKKQLRQVQLENEFLKKTSAFFASLKKSDF